MANLSTENAVDTSRVLWVEKPPPIPVTAETVGVQFIDGNCQDQVAILCAMVDELGLWTERESWPMQCRRISDEMPDEYRAKVATMLGILCDHLSEPK